MIKCSAHKNKHFRSLKDVERMWLKIEDHLLLKNKKRHSTKLPSNLKELFERIENRNRTVPLRTVPMILHPSWINRVVQTVDRKNVPFNSVKSGQQTQKAPSQGVANASTSFDQLLGIDRANKWNTKPDCRFNILCGNASALFEGKANDFFWRYH